MIDKQLKTQKDRAFRAVLGTWDNDDLVDYLVDCLDKGELIDSVVDVFSEEEVSEILLRPENAAILKAAGLAIEDGEVVLVRLCGGAKTPEEEHALYLRAMDGTL